MFVICISLCCDSFEASAGSNGNAMDSECFGQFLEPFGIPEANWGMYFHGFDRAGNGLVDVRKAWMLLCCCLNAFVLLRGCCFYAAA